MKAGKKGTILQIQRARRVFAESTNPEWRETELRHLWIEIFDSTVPAPSRLLRVEDECRRGAWSNCDPAERLFFAMLLGRAIAFDTTIGDQGKPAFEVRIVIPTRLNENGAHTLAGVTVPLRDNVSIGELLKWARELLTRRVVEHVWFAEFETEESAAAIGDWLSDLILEREIVGEDYQCLNHLWRFDPERLASGIASTSYAPRQVD